MNDPIQLATHRFEQGFSCSQAIFTTFAPQFGVGDDIAGKIASPFGGGIARQGETCGAVTGALMVLGLKYGALGEENKDKIYQVSQEFLRRFQEQHTFIKCKQLINYDISQPVELQAAREAKVFTQICPILVKTAAEIVQSMLTSDQTII
jgi:C_GCAxxG_C_C family probable redox protein